MMALNKTKYQFSLRLERPPKTAYFLNASMYQVIPLASPVVRCRAPGAPRARIHMSDAGRSASAFGLFGC